MYWFGDFYFCVYMYAHVCLCVRFLFDCVYFSMCVNMWISVCVCLYVRILVCVYVRRRPYRISSFVTGAIAWYGNFVILLYMLKVVFCVPVYFFVSLVALYINLFYVIFHVTSHYFLHFTNLIFVYFVSSKYESFVSVLILL